MQETEWLGQVMNGARRTNWPCRYHTSYSIGSPPGYPDVTLAKPGRLIFAELKTDEAQSKLYPEQLRWLELLVSQQSDGMSHEVYLWRPSDAAEVWRILAMVDRPEKLHNLDTADLSLKTTQTKLERRLARHGQKGMFPA